jgi:hypothetical protein
MFHVWERVFNLFCCSIKDNQYATKRLKMEQMISAVSKALAVLFMRLVVSVFIRLRQFDLVN